MSGSIVTSCSLICVTQRSPHTFPVLEKSARGMLWTIQDAGKQSLKASMGRSERRMLLEEMCWLVWLSRTRWTAGECRLGAPESGGSYRETHRPQEKILLNDTRISLYTCGFYWVIHHLKSKDFFCKAEGIVYTEHRCTTELVQHAFPRLEQRNYLQTAVVRTAEKFTQCLLLLEG